MGIITDRLTRRELLGQAGKVALAALGAGIFRTRDVLAEPNPFLAPPQHEINGGGKTTFKGEVRVGEVVTNLVNPHDDLSDPEMGSYGFEVRDIGRSDVEVGYLYGGLRETEVLPLGSELHNGVLYTLTRTDRIDTLSVEIAPLNYIEGLGAVSIHGSETYGHDLLRSGVTFKQERTRVFSLKLEDGSEAVFNVAKKDDTVIVAFNRPNHCGKLIRTEGGKQIFAPLHVEVDGVKKDVTPMQASVTVPFGKKMLIVHEKATFSMEFSTNPQGELMISIDMVR